MHQASGSIPKADKNPKTRARLLLLHCTTQKSEKEPRKHNAALSNHPKNCKYTWSKFRNPLVTLKASCLETKRANQSSCESEYSCTDLDNCHNSGHRNTGVSETYAGDPLNALLLQEMLCRNADLLRMHPAARPISRLPPRRSHPPRPCRRGYGHLRRLRPSAHRSKVG